MTKRPNKILVLSVVAATAFWTLDVLVDHILPYGEPVSTLWSFTGRESIFRMIFALSFIAYGIMMSQVFSRQKKDEETLKKEIASHSKARESLQNSYQQLTAILNNIPDLAWLKDKEGRFVSVNGPFGKACGVNPGELMGKTDFEIWPEKLARAYRADDKEVMESGRKKQVEEPLIDSAGNVTWIETIKTPIYNEQGEIIGTTGIARDVTERKRAVQELEKYQRRLESIVEMRTSELETANKKLQEEIRLHKKSETDLSSSLDKLRNIMSAVPDIIYMLDNGGCLVMWNTNLETVSGYSTAELVGKHVFELMSDDDRDGAYERMQEAFETGYSSRELTLVTKKGSRIPYFFSGAPFRDGAGNVIGLVGVGKDMTEHMTSEAKMNFLASIVQAIPDAVCSMDMDGKIRSWNDGAEKMMGYTSREITGKPFSTLLPAEGFASGLAYCTGILDAQGHFSGHRSVMKTKSGGTVQVEITGMALKDKRQHIVGYAFVVRNSSALRAMEEDLLKTEKLESLAILAGGIAHDFNNLLTAILGNISLSKRFVEADPAVYGILMDAEKALYKARDLTHQLLTFSKGGIPIKKITSLEVLVSDAADFALRGSNVMCRFHFDDGLWSVEADEGQMSQVFYNLIINAHQAMPKGGIITIRCENMLLDNNALPPLKEGRYVKVSIQDQGGGIPRENLQRIFDPYFTTKRQGTGLGLATSYSIIKKHDGHIAVESSGGTGTAFSIYIPATDKKMPEAIKPGKTLFKGRGRVLVMEDEEIIRLILMKMLAEIGYETGFAPDGEQTIALYKKARESGSPFDAVLIDLTIRGGMGGQECIQQLLKYDPEVKAIVSSGYADAPVMANYREHGFMAIITKPYQIEDLSEVLYRVITGIQR